MTLPVVDAPLCLRGGGVRRTGGRAAAGLGRSTGLDGRAGSTRSVGAVAEIGLRTGTSGRGGTRRAAGRSAGVLRAGGG